MDSLCTLFPHKRAYWSRRQARRVRRREQLRLGIRMSVYRCVSCGLFHVGSFDPARTRAEHRRRNS